MPLLDRSVTVSLRFPTTQTVAKTVRFIPNLSAAEGQVLLEEFYDVSVIPTSPVANSTLSGTAVLPTSNDAGVSISYRVEFPGTTSKKSKYINLAYGDGSTTTLAALIEEAENG